MGFIEYVKQFSLWTLSLGFKSRTSTFVPGMQKKEFSGNEINATIL